MKTWLLRRKWWALAWVAGWFLLGIGVEIAKFIWTGKI